MSAGNRPTENPGAGSPSGAPISSGLNVSLLGAKPSGRQESVRPRKPNVTADPSTQIADTPAAPRPVAGSGNPEPQPKVPRADVVRRGDMVPRADVEQLLQLIQALAASKDRTEAIRVLVDRVAQAFPNATIRCGYGGKYMRRLYDQKLGWLGAESSLFDTAQERWANRIPGAQPPTEDGQLTVFTVPLAQPDADGLCLVWVSGFQSPPHWLLAGADAIRAVFWEQPSNSWLRAPERMRSALTMWGCIAGFVLLAVAAWPVRYRIPCTAIVQPVHERLVAAPFEATLLSSSIQPGDVVKAGQSLVQLDGRPLRLELESIQSEIQRLDKDHNVALANGRIAEAQQAALSKRKAERQQELLSNRLNQLDVISPIDGVVVSGDLERYVGSPLEMGQTIVEIAPLAQVTVEIEIPEFEIGYVENDCETRVRFSSVGGKSIRQTVETVYPSAEIRDDRSVFVAKIEVDNEDGKLRPGMRGDATTFGPLRPLSWSWVRGSWERMLWWAGY